MLCTANKAACESACDALRRAKETAVFDMSSSNIAVSIERQSCRYQSVPAKLDYTKLYSGSVGKLQRDVETQKITIPTSGNVKYLATRDCIYSKIMC